MGLDVYLRNGPEPDYETDREGWKAAFDETHNTKSSQYPDHLCGPRYLRSSYNSGGFNSVVGDWLGKDLYWVFEPNEGEYPWSPPKDHLTKARERAVELAGELRKVEKPLAAFDVNSVGFECGSDAEAIKITKEKLSSDGFDAFSCREGFFTKKGLEIFGALPGRAWGQMTTYLVHAIDLDWYIAMADIVIEFIDAALSMDDPRISWSG